MKKFSPRSAAESIVVSVDLAHWIPTGLTITAAAVLASVYISNRGAPDPDPGATLVGDPQVSGTIVLQRVRGGVVTCDYVLTFRVTLSDGSIVDYDALQTVSPYVPF